MLDTRSSAPRAAAGTHRRRRPAKTLRRLAELLALTAFAIAQPILDVTGRAPDFFLYRRVNTGEMRLFLLLVAFAAPLLLFAVEQVAGMVSKVAQRTLHLAFVMVLFAVIVIEVGKKTGPFTGIPLVLLAIVAGGALAVALVRKPAFRQAVTYASVAPVVFSLLFTMSPAGSLVLGGNVRGGGSVVRNRPPIVFLFLDEFPLRTLLDANGRIEGNLFPNFARLQQMSTWYSNGTGINGYTPNAAPAMLRGVYPKKSQAASYINYPETIFTLLAGSYRMRAYETISDLCPPGMCVDVASGRKIGMRALGEDTLGVARDLLSPYRAKKAVTEQFVENAVDTAKQAAEGKAAPDARAKWDKLGVNQPQRFGPFLDGLVQRQEPNLHFMHVLLPHEPHRYLPSGTFYRDPPHGLPKNKPDPTRPPYVTQDDPLYSMFRKQRLLMQTMYTDTLLGAMLNRMQATGLLDRALLVVTADHGNGLGTRTLGRQIDDRNPADLAWVPMFVKVPGQKQGKVDDRNAQTVDLLPTIADVLDVDVPWQMDGMSLLGPPRATTDKLWINSPAQPPKHIDPAKWLPTVRQGYAAELGAHAAEGASGLYKIGPLGGLVGRKVADLQVGSPSPITATMHRNVKLANVDPASGALPACIFGYLDRPAGPRSTWLLGALNGTVAGTVAAMESDGNWFYAGMLDETLFRKNQAKIELFQVEGTTLHPIRLVT